MDPRQSITNFALKLGNKDKVHFVFDKLPDAQEFLNHLRSLGNITHPDGQSFPYYFTVKNKNEIETIRDENRARYIVRMHPYTYNTFGPGQSKPHASIQQGTGNPPAWQIIFTEHDRAKLYSAHLHAMHINVLNIPPQYMDVEYNNKNNTWVVRTDDIGKLKLDIAEKYFQYLLPYQAIKYIEKECANILEIFKRDAWNDFAHSSDKKIITRESIKLILNDQHLSQRKKLEGIINIFHKRHGKGGINFFRAIIRSSESENFNTSVTNLKLEEKLNTILDNAKSIANPLFEFSHAQRETLSNSSARNISTTTTTTTTTPTPFYTQPFPQTNQWAQVQPQPFLQTSQPTIPSILMTQHFYQSPNQGITLFNNQQQLLQQQLLRQQLLQQQQNQMTGITYTPMMTNPPGGY